MTSKPNQGRAEIIADLQRLLPRLQERGVERALPFGLPSLDSHLPGGGLAFGALHEVAPAAARDTPAAVGFVTALLGRMAQSGPVLLITSPRGLGGWGRLHGHGMNLLGLDPARVILVEAPDEKHALWAIEEALRSAVPAIVAGAIGCGLDLKTSQRLQLAARTSGLPLLLLRPAGEMGANTAVTRWSIAAAEAPRDRFGLLAGWRWQVRLERCRNGRPGEWVVEWDHVAHRFSLVPALANSALPQSTILQPLLHPLRRAG